MKVFLYEFISGGGCFHHSIDHAPAGSLLNEGLAMWQAVYEDLARIEHVQVVSTRDARLPSMGHDVIRVDEEDTAVFLQLAMRSDVTLVIAPEFDGHLEHRVCLLERAGCTLLGPDFHFVYIASSKSLTSRHLAAAGVRVPFGRLLKSGQVLPSDIDYPAVVKRNDGAGSMARVLHGPPGEPFSNDMFLEELLSGIPCSQSFLCCGDRPPIACPPMQQRIATDGSLQYLGGERIRCTELVDRASVLAAQTIQALPATRGYVGVDMMMGNAPDGSEDYVLEINPRLTTSYIGLRHVTDDNLMQAMLDIALGKPAAVCFHDRPVSFLADGTLNQ